MIESPKYKVAEVFNDRELAITGGTMDGLQVDDVLRVIDPQGKQIRDPDTGEVLGEIVHTKAVVRVYEARERFALARTFRTRRVNVGGTSGGLIGFGKVFEAPRWETRIETLRRDPDKALWDAPPADSIVSPGDVAEKVDEAGLDDIPSFTIWE